mgnify:CR=1 FL=1
MDTIKQISAECWAIFKKFAAQDKTDENWEAFIAIGQDITEKYTGIEKKFAIEMFLAFSNYIERQEKLKRGEPI